MKKFIKWFKTSNRDKHFYGGIISGFFGTIILAIGLGLGMEFKDKMYGNKFDYTDLNMTIAGGVVGQILQVLLLILLF